MTKIKICGLRREEDIASVNACMPDYAGFVFAKSKRQITAGEAERLRKQLHPKIAPVGVFVNEDVNVVAELLNCGIIDMAQLHGEETEEYIAELSSKINRGKLIKAVRVKKKQDILKAEGLAVDYLLLDAFSDAAYGGTGETFDWNLIGTVEKPYFLAGGIHPGNLEAAIKNLHPFAVDVSSAVETGGYNDREKIRQIVEQVRSMEEI